MKVLYDHNGVGDFPHGAGASDAGYYEYSPVIDPDIGGGVSTWHAEPTSITAEQAKERMASKHYTHFIMDWSK
jgi:hypothetical protein